MIPKLDIVDCKLKPGPGRRATIHRYNGLRQGLCGKTSRAVCQIARPGCRVRANPSDV